MIIEIEVVSLNKVASLLFQDAGDDRPKSKLGEKSND